MNYQKKLFLGNLYSKRDWGHAKEYVEAMWLILQQKKPDDFVISSGQQSTVKKFVELTAKKLGIPIKWKGKGVNEKGYDPDNNVIIECDKSYHRPLEVNNLLGDSKKALKILGWRSKINLSQLISEMIEEELNSLRINHF